MQTNLFLVDLDTKYCDLHFEISQRHSVRLMPARFIKRIDSYLIGIASDRFRMNDLTDTNMASSL